MSTAFALSALVTLIALSSAPGCGSRCFNNFDCGEHAFCGEDGRCSTECFTDLDCWYRPQCNGKPEDCRAQGFQCTDSGRCVSGGPPNEPDELVEGWDDPPGTGYVFVLDSVGIADGDVGFDLDDSCAEEGINCVDNALAELGPLMNDQIRQGLLGGEALILVEIAGVDALFGGDDRSVTMKIYAARDADDPFFPANNFKVPPGDTTCCEFLINPISVSGVPPQAVARIPARIDSGRLTSLLPGELPLPCPQGLEMDSVLASMNISRNLGTISDGLLGAVVPIGSLATIENPYCKTVSPRCTVQLAESKMLDLFVNLVGQPDIDLDLPRDGVECVRDTDGDGVVDGCCEGNLGGPCFDAAGVCIGASVPPIETGVPGSCARNSKMSDGYSVTWQFSGVAATIIGIGQ